MKLFERQLLPLQSSISVASPHPIPLPAIPGEGIRWRLAGHKSHGGLGKLRTAGTPVFSTLLLNGPVLNPRCANVNIRSKIDAKKSTYDHCRLLPLVRIEFSPCLIWHVIQELNDTFHSRISQAAQFEIISKSSNRFPPHVGKPISHKIDRFFRGHSIEPPSAQDRQRTRLMPVISSERDTVDGADCRRTGTVENFKNCPLPSRQPLTKGGNAILVIELTRARWRVMESPAEPQAFVAEAFSHEPGGSATGLRIASSPCDIEGCIYQFPIGPTEQKPINFESAGQHSVVLTRSAIPLSSPLAAAGQAS
ncbi:MAG: hypothetical protein JWM57_3564 [Phycisphaerales bacterium]|nr:hypothetical protein [Phycisphaerales bacterium]